MKFSITKIFLLSLMLVLLVVGCEEDPTSVGSELIPDGDQFEFITIDSNTGNFPQRIRRNYVVDTVNTGTAVRLILGRVDNMESVVLTRYIPVLTDSLSEEYLAGNLTVTDAWIEIEPHYFTVDLNKTDPFTKNFDFTVHEVNSGWTSNGMIADSLDILEYEPEDMAVTKTFYDSTANPYPDNPDSNFVMVKINKDMVKRWIDESEDLAVDKPNEGLLYKPTPGADIAWGWWSASFFNDITTLSYLYIEIENQNGVMDTLATIPRNDVHVVTGDDPQPAADQFYLQDGLVTRADYIMDLSSVPENVIINSATLELFVDTTKTVYSTRKADTISVAMYADTSANTFWSVGVQTLGRVGNHKYEGSVQEFVNLWLNRREGYPNHGVRFWLPDEQRALNSLVLYGSNAADSLKPRLTITYSKRK